MSRTSFHGSFETSSPEAVEGVLRSWLSTDDLRMRLRRGWETHYETEGFEVLCYEESPQTSSEGFLLEGHIDGMVDAAASRLQELAEHCRNVKLEFTIDYEEVDLEGNPLSGERSIS
ncbi:hypothetical protein [Nocardia sp. NPDC051570]|uniref:hypothetical protein n=1 Tax=Nocardia sp. NPDC051570 TaxID=3364324 RepID=UPI00378BD57E